MIKRNTHQKEIIMESIKEDYTHPTFYDIFRRVKLKDASIGQATVYRNIKKMVDEGDILKIKFLNNEFHYDANICRHNHFICTKCGKIIDIYDDDYKKNKTISNKLDVIIEKVSILYEGICSNCQK